MTKPRPASPYLVTAADGTEHVCPLDELGATLRALPGWRGFRVVTAADRSEPAGRRGLRLVK